MAFAPALPLTPQTALFIVRAGMHLLDLGVGAERAGAQPEECVISWLVGLMGEEEQAVRESLRLHQKE